VILKDVFVVPVHVRVLYTWGVSRQTTIEVPRLDQDRIIRMRIG
jgi:hypothetical protein